MAKFELKAKEFRKMSDPVYEQSGRTKYVCYIQANTIPFEFKDWLATNPREQKMTTNVAKEIKKSLNDNPNFHELNRGILLSVDSVRFDNKDDIVTIVMNDPEKHGNVDGGHTLSAVLEAKTENSLRDNVYVFFEIFTGIDSPVELAAARNTSVQVDLKSIEELKRSFDVIRTEFENLDFGHRIAYKMNEHHGDEDIKNILDVREIIAILLMFSQQVYPYRTVTGSLSETQPIQCYSGKEASLKKFLYMDKHDPKGKREEMIKDMSPIIKDIFDLWDVIERSFPGMATKAGKRYGSRKYSKYNEGKIVGTAFFSEAEVQHVVPKGLMYPLVGAFRALVNVDSTTGEYSWAKDPMKTWETMAVKLVTIILDESAENPDALAKNSNLWSNLFKEIFIHAYMN